MLKTIFSDFLWIYRKYLARFFVFRLLRAFLLLLYQQWYRVGSFMNARPESGPYSFVTLKMVAKESQYKSIVVAGDETIPISVPTFSGYGSEIAGSRNPAISIVAPSLEVVEFPGAVAVGGVDFVFVGGRAVHHDLYDIRAHRCPGENIGVVSIDRRRGSVALRSRRPSLSVGVVASLIGQCSANYAHWLTETLPKLAILDACGAFMDVPLLVDAGLHENIYESIRLLNRGRRELVRVERWQSVVADSIICVSQPGYERYAPHDIYGAEAPGYSNVFSRKALRMLRDASLEALAAEFRPKWKKLYLGRNARVGNIRKIENAAEVEEVMREQGFEVITPETMTFSEQVATCCNAEVIVAPIGAALANMTFAPPGCDVIALSPFYEKANYFYYTNLAGVLGHRLQYVLGRQVSSAQHPMHRNYEIDLSCLRAALRPW